MTKEQEEIFNKSLELLDKYFQETPREEILKKIEEIDKKFPNLGPTIKEYLKSLPK